MKMHTNARGNRQRLERLLFSQWFICFLLIQIPSALQYPWTMLPAPFNNAPPHLKLILFWKARISHRIEFHAAGMILFAPTAAMEMGTMEQICTTRFPKLSLLSCIVAPPTSMVDPSVGCEDCPPALRTYHILGNLLSKSLGAADRSGIANRTVVASVEFPDSPSRSISLHTSRGGHEFGSSVAYTGSYPHGPSHEAFTGQTVQVLYVVDAIYAGIGGRDMVRISLRYNAAGCNQRNPLHEPYLSQQGQALHGQIRAWEAR